MSRGLGDVYKRQLNHFVLIPRLARAATRPRGGVASPEGALALSLAAEVLLGAVVLAVTAVLVALPRPE